MIRFALLACLAGGACSSATPARDPMSTRGPAQEAAVPRAAAPEQQARAAAPEPQPQRAPRVRRTVADRVDISTTKGKIKDWGVFGLGSLGGTSSVISTHRTSRDKPSDALYRFRVVSTAVHEVGHMLGLDHCTEPRCVMNDAEGSIKNVDGSTGELGPVCVALLDGRSPATLEPVQPKL